MTQQISPFRAANIKHHWLFVWLEECRRLETQLCNGGAVNPASLTVNAWEPGEEQLINEAQQQCRALIETLEWLDGAVQGQETIQRLGGSSEPDVVGMVVRITKQWDGLQREELIRRLGGYVNQEAYCTCPACT